MGKKKTETKETAKATTTPNVPDWITGPMQAYLQQVQQFGGRDPARLVPGASGLQQQAFQRAQQMAGRSFGQQPQAPQPNPLAMTPPSIAGQYEQIQQANPGSQPIDPELMRRYTMGY